MSGETCKKRRVVGAARVRLPQYDEVDASQFRLMAAKRLAHDALQPVAAAGGAAMLLRYGQAEPRAIRSVGFVQDGKEFIAAPGATAKDAAEGSRIRQAVRLPEPVQPIVVPFARSSVVIAIRCRPAAQVVCRCYGVSCARPFARRRFRTSRPAFVAMRARKP